MKIYQKLTLTAAGAALVTLGITGTVSAVTIGAPVAPPATVPGTGLNGAYYQTRVNSVAAADTYANANTPTATFTGANINYGPITRSGITTLSTFLGSDGASLSAAKNNPLYPAILTFRGLIDITTAGGVDFGLSSDDGSILSIGGVTVVNNDGIHVSKTVTGTATFSQAGLYTIALTYFENPAAQAILSLTERTGTNPFATVPTSQLYSSVPESSEILGTLAFGMMGAGYMLKRQLKKA